MTLLDLIDHIIVIAPDLEQGMDHAEAVLGVRPVRAGRHPAFGTHNALLSLLAKGNSLLVNNLSKGDDLDKKFP